jgi:hypothetical protein
MLHPRLPGWGIFVQRTRWGADSYDFAHGRRRTLSVVDLCHGIVHSLTFTFYCGEATDLFDGV